MRIATSIAFAVVAGIWCSGPARADTSGELLPGCQALVNSLKTNGSSVTFALSEETARCWSYFGALQDIAVIQWNGEDTPALHACLPPESRRTQLIQVFVDYAQQHPEKGEETGALVFVDAVERLWPCPAAQ